MKENIHNIDYGEAKRAASNNISIQNDEIQLKNAG